MTPKTKSEPKRPRKTIERPREPGAPFRIEQAAAELNLAPRTVRQRCKTGELRSYKDGRLVLIAEEDLMAYQAERRGQRPEEVVKLGTGLIRRHLVRPASGSKGKGRAGRD